MRRLPAAVYLAFPLRIGANGAATSQRREHVRETIAQVIGTAAGERIFRPEFGAGLQRLLFEPNAADLWDMARKRLSTSLAEALRGEVDPRTLSVEIDGPGADQALAEGTLRIRIDFALAALGERAQESFVIGPAAGSHG